MSSDNNITAANNRPYSTFSTLKKQGHQLVFTSNQGYRCLSRRISNWRYISPPLNEFQFK